MASGHNAYIDVDGNDVSGATNSWTLPIEEAVEEVTCFGTDFEEYEDLVVAGWRASVKGQWNGEAGEIDEILFGLVGAGAVPFILGPEGNDVGKRKYAGDVILKSYEPGAEVKGAILWSAELQGTGTLTRGTF